MSQICDISSSSFHSISLAATEKGTLGRRAYRRGTLMGIAEYADSLLRHDMLPEHRKYEKRFRYCEEVSVGDLDMTQADLNLAEEALGCTVMGLTRRKCDDLNSWVQDILINSFEELFRLDATPVPQISESEQEAVVEALYQMLISITEERTLQSVASISAEAAEQGGTITNPDALAVSEERGIPTAPTPEDIDALVEANLGAARSYIRNRAQEGAKGMTREIMDDFKEAGFFDELRAFFQDFSRLPAGFLHAPYLKDVKSPSWKGDKLVMGHEVLCTGRRVSFWDMFWTRDNTDLQDGLAVAERCRYMRHELELFKSRPAREGYINSEIDSLLDEKDITSRDWMNTPLEEDYCENGLRWGDYPSEYIYAFKVWMVMSKDRLRDAPDLQKLLDKTPAQIKDEQYLVEVTLIDGFVIKAALHDAHCDRPYYTASYENKHAEVVGKGLPEIIKGEDAAARRVIDMILKNAALSATPARTVDAGMMDEDGWEEEGILPDQEYMISARPGSTSKAIEYIDYPSRVSELVSLYQFISSIGDLNSGIPPFATGSAANLPHNVRTDGMLSFLTSQAQKPISSRLLLAGRDTLVPAVRNAYWHKMKYDKDIPEEYKVDANIDVAGFEHELLHGSKIQNLERALAIMSQAAGAIDPRMVNSTFMGLLRELDVNLEDYQDPITLLNPPQPQAQPQLPQDQQALAQQPPV